jgi:hypothetical protein
MSQADRHAMKATKNTPPVQSGSMVIIVKFQFAAVHYWPGAPRGSILQHPHRHVFHVSVTKGVSHNDRAIEFIELKAQMEKAAQALYCRRPTPNSCEMMARSLGTMFRCIQVAVLEDNENGAVWSSDSAARQ